MTSTAVAGAQEQVAKPTFKQHRIHLGLISESRGLSLGYEYRPASLKGLVGIKGFIGYGVNFFSKRKELGGYPAITEINASQGSKHPPKERFHSIENKESTISG